MKTSPFVALICCAFSTCALAQSTDSTNKATAELKQTPFVLGEASSMAPPKSSSSVADPANSDFLKSDGGPGPLIATKAADGTISIGHEGDPASTKEVQ